MERTLQHAVEDAVSYESYRLRKQQEECRSIVEVYPS